ncbi:holo-[acyl-carrier-protein] synthase [Syntrophotalea acetylenivorans]|uniref:Holo-[acyl-carrier-protein] synthase n=1 Tax=Syntrophotalea acetylenivorans TaxID=1842532 RepID=A0A1L3GNC4_9BACT|nr:holo-ACP synthase [Syntrophotalea acetylenivorans]APG27439.1 holo-[acyl-carrier-protein] synthase [Syntrophotalea acetylenivorans]
MTARISGLGNDLVRIARFRCFVEENKQALLERIFTAGELAYSLPKADPASHLAARFAAKEALLKALGLGLRRGIRWHEVQVVRNDLGQPAIVLSGRAEELFRDGGHETIHLSCSHDGDYAFATVILEGC